jgi:hypothetical protein
MGLEHPAHQRLYSMIDSAITDSLPDREVLHGQPNILLINLARQW